MTILISIDSVVGYAHDCAYHGNTGKKKQRELPPQDFF